MWEQFLAADGQLLLWIQNSLRVQALTPVMRVITHLADHGLFWIILTLALLIPKKTRWIGIASACALVCSVTINNLILKHVVNRVRPYEVVQGLQLLVGKADDASFPSGHSAASFASAVAIFRSTVTRNGRRIAICLLVLAVLIALSRLYVGIHYPTDVLCGVISGICCGLIGAAVAKRLKVSHGDRFPDSFSNAK